MVEANITSIENWYKEVAADRPRPILLSKLAIIELCGWIEGWLDEFILEVADKSLGDRDWVLKNVIESNFGFHYEKHLRTMLVKILGEVSVRRIELDYKHENNDDFDMLKSSLGMLWEIRCKLAHADIAAHQGAAIKINAPSWTKVQYKQTSRRLISFRAFTIAYLENN